MGEMAKAVLVSWTLKVEAEDRRCSRSRGSLEIRVQRLPFLSFLQVFEHLQCVQEGATCLWPMVNKTYLFPSKHRSEADRLIQYKLWVPRGGASNPVGGACRVAWVQELARRG